MNQTLTIVLAGIVALLGKWRLTWQVAVLFLIAVAGGVLVLFAWPDHWVIASDD